MSILAKEDRKDLVWAMRTSLLEQVRSGVLTEGKKAAAENFIINEATYEQLLNLAFNPERETNYQPIEVLEKVALESYAATLEEEVTPEETAPVQETSVFEQVEKSLLKEAEEKPSWMKKFAGKFKEVSKAAWEKAKAAGRNVKEHKGRYFLITAGTATAGVGAAKYLKHRREKKAAGV